MAVALALGAAAVGSLGCGQSTEPTRLTAPTVTPTPGFTLPDEGAPLAAFVYIRGDPPDVGRDLEMSLRLVDSAVAVLTFSFKATERFAASDATLAGLYTVSIDDTACSGRINLLAGRETDAVLSIASDDSCEIAAEGSHEASEPHAIAAVGGQVVGEIPPNTTVKVVSMDSPANAVPDPRAPDEGGIFYFPSLLPGRYDIVLHSGKATLDRETIDLAAGQELTMELGPGTS